MSLMNLTATHPDGDLVIPGRPDASLGHGAWITKLTLPDRTWRRGYAPPSQYTTGQTLLSAALGPAAITALVSIKAPTSTDLGDELTHLELVLSQFAYTLTTVTETRAQDWNAEPADVIYGEYSVGTDRMAAVQLTLSIPASPTA